MPETPSAATGNKGVVALVLIFSAVLLISGALLAYTGVLPVEEQVRPFIALALGIAGVLDLVIGLMFFSKSRSS